jgi:hypothetical protein
MRMGARSVAIGEQVQELGIGYLGKRAPVWVVEETFTKADERHYAKLICAADASLQKTLSIAALADRRRFARLRSPR